MQPALNISRGCAGPMVFAVCGLEPTDGILKSVENALMELRNKDCDASQLPALVGSLSAKSGSGVSGAHPALSASKS